MVFITGYVVRHKKFNEAGTVVSTSLYHVQIQWGDGRTSTYTKDFARRILERV